MQRPIQSVLQKGFTAGYQNERVFYLNCCEAIKVHKMPWGWHQSKEWIGLYKLIKQDKIKFEKGKDLKSPFEDGNVCMCVCLRSEHVPLYMYD